MTSPGTMASDDGRARLRATGAGYGMMGRGYGTGYGMMGQGYGYGPMMGRGIWTRPRHDGSR